MRGNLQPLDSRRWMYQKKKKHRRQTLHFACQKSLHQSKQLFAVALLPIFNFNPVIGHPISPALEEKLNVGWLQDDWMHFGVKRLALWPTCFIRGPRHRAADGQWQRRIHPALDQSALTYHFLSFSSFTWPIASIRCFIRPSVIVLSFD